MQHVQRVHPQARRVIQENNIGLNGNQLPERPLRRTFDEHQICIGEGCVQGFGDGAIIRYGQYNIQRRYFLLRIAMRLSYTISV